MQTYLKKSRLDPAVVERKVTRIRTSVLYPAPCTMAPRPKFIESKSITTRFVKAKLPDEKSVVIVDKFDPKGAELQIFARLYVFAGDTDWPVRVAFLHKDVPINYLPSTTEFLIAERLLKNKSLFLHLHDIGVVLNRDFLKPNQSASRISLLNVIASSKNRAFFTYIHHSLVLDVLRFVSHLAGYVLVPELICSNLLAKEKHALQQLTSGRSWLILEKEKRE